MLRGLIQQLYEDRYQLLFYKGYINGEIVKIEDEVYEKLDNYYYEGIPVSMHLKYPELLAKEKRYDNSKYIITALNDAILVTGNNKDLELKYGKRNCTHSWIEKDGWVYDPMILLKFKKELYYKIFLPTKMSYQRSAGYINTDWYKNIIDTKIEDLKPNGKKRIELCRHIPRYQTIAERFCPKNVTEELEKYLKTIEYNYDEIIEEIEKSVQYIKK